MRRPTVVLFWIEVAVGAAACGLFLVSLVWRDWIELLTGAEPDGGGGAVEWSTVAALLATSLACSALARRGRRALTS